MDNLLNIAMAAWFLLMGLMCINKTHKIQKWLKLFHESVPAAQAWSFIFDWTQKPGFITMTRIIGVLSMLNFFMLVYVIMYGDNSIPL